MKSAGLFLGAVLAIALQPALAEPVAIHTGKGSHKEQKIGGSIVRFGSNTRAQISDSGSVSVDHGLILISSQSGLLRRAAVTVTTPERSIIVRGTGLAVMVPGKGLKVTCIEGKVEVGQKGDKQVLGAGDLLVVTSEGQAGLAQVELESLIQSCALLDGDFSPLPRAEAIAKIADRQMNALQKAAEHQAVTIAHHESGIPVHQPNGKVMAGGAGMQHLASSTSSTRVTSIGMGSVFVPIGGAQLPSQSSATGASTMVALSNLTPAGGTASAASSSSSSSSSGYSYSGSASSSWSGGASLTISRPSYGSSYGSSSGSISRPSYGSSAGVSFGSLRASDSLVILRPLP